MIVTPEYLETLPDWLSKILTEKRITKVIDTFAEPDFVLEDVPNYRIMSRGDEKVLVEEDEDGEINITCLKDGEPWIFLNCVPVGYTSSDAEPVDTGTVVVEVLYNFAAGVKE